jgi:thiol:disulfide interchange protein
MIAMCVYLARTVIGETWAMYLYGGVAAAMAVYYLIALIKQQ